MQNNICEIQVLGDTTEWTVTAADHPALAPRRIRHFGFSDAGPGYQFVRHRPGFGALFVCVGGQGKVWADGGWRACGAGQIYLTPAHAYHAYETIPACRWDVGWFALEEPKGEAPLVNLPEPSLRTASVEGIAKAMRGFHDEFDGPKSPLHLEAWLQVIHLELERLLRQDRPMDQRLEGVWSEVGKTPGRPWDLKTLSRMASLSGEQFRHLCNKTFGESPMAHVTAIRMRRACQLILRSDLPVGDIAEKVGYTNQFAFSTAFKRHTGATPRGYRQTQR